MKDLTTRQRFHKLAAVALNSILPRDLSQSVLPTTRSIAFFHILNFFLKGILISTSNNAYHHSAFVETEMTTNLVSRATWVESQGYQNQGDKSRAEEVKKWKEKCKPGNAQNTNSNLLEPLTLISLSAKSFCCQGSHCTYAFIDRLTTFPCNLQLTVTINMPSLMKELQCM